MWHVWMAAMTVAFAGIPALAQDAPSPEKPPAVQVFGIGGSQEGLPEGLAEKIQSIFDEMQLQSSDGDVMSFVCSTDSGLDALAFDELSLGALETSMFIREE